jgi:hypothetical protein
MAVTTSRSTWDWDWSSLVGSAGASSVASWHRSILSSQSLSG